MENPLVSIITPCYNGEAYLDRFFGSILRQTYPNLEVVFVNDGSTDKTEAVAKAYGLQLEEKGISFIYVYQENAGQAAALNRGLKLFHGEYLTCMDSDDEILPLFIERRIDYFREHSDCRFCYGKAIAVREEEPDVVIQEIGSRPVGDVKNFFLDVLYVRNIFFAGYTVSREALDTVIRDRDIYAGAGGQNAQLLLPLAWYYGEPSYVEDSVYKYYIRENSHSHSIDTSERTIRQLSYYEAILTETLARIEDERAHDYIPAVRRYYARLRFGNAVDTQRADLIKMYYGDLKTLGIGTMRDRLLCIKYTNAVIRKLMKIG